MSDQDADQGHGASADARMRTVVFHYHLFKNAGTSLDALFRQHFGEGWVTTEFPGQVQANRQGQRAWIEGHPTAACFSSHTALLTRHSLPDVHVVPVIFVRHPLDRIASAYSFERQQEDPSFGSTLARHTTLQGYIETRLSIRQDRQCRNFHVSRFADMFRDESDSETAAAERALESLPFVGVVEEFSESLERLQALLRVEGFPDIALRSIQRNVTAGRPATLDERLDRMAQEIGARCYESLVQANAEDLAFYNAAVDAWAHSAQAGGIGGG